MSGARRATEAFADWVERFELHGERLAPEALCAAAAERDELRRLIEDYDALRETLGSDSDDRGTTPADDGPLPRFDGFRTVERIGGGGGGVVYKLEDESLGRFVAAKVLRDDSDIAPGLDAFLREARSLALFEDPRVVRIFEFRKNSEPPVLLMEYVDGFSLDRIAPSLEYRQRARLLAEIAEAIHRAHRLGVQHRDLKPANVRVDADLHPRILDFGLSDGRPDRGHGLGTPAYMAPEQLDPARPIDERTDVYALGVMLYETLCGARPFHATSREEWIATIRRGEPRLPAEVRPDVPEPLQAIALKAMETDPSSRYAGADEFAADLRRFLDGEPVTARPTLYHGVLGRRVQPHLEQIREWRRLRLIWPHEERELVDRYRRLETREEEWFLRSRALSWSQISLYLGAVVLFAGGLFYFMAHLLSENGGIVGPLVFLALPFVTLNLLGRRYYLEGRGGLGVAFHLAAVALLPLFLLAAFQEWSWWPAPEGAGDLLGESLGISDRRLQVVAGLTVMWAATVAFVTRTVTLSAYAMVFVLLFHLSLLTDFGLVDILDEERWDLLGARLLILVPVLVSIGVAASLARRPWFARPAHVAAAVVGVFALELTALDGRALEWLGVSVAPLLHGSEADPVFLATTVAMASFGVLYYVAGRLAETRGDSTMSTAAWLLCTLAPFAVLQPIGLIAQRDYPDRFVWIYLALAVGTVFLSRLHQRKAFYWAGLTNTALALFLVTDHYDWWDRRRWAIAVLLGGLVVLAAGVLLHHREGETR